MGVYLCVSTVHYHFSASLACNCSCITLILCFFYGQYCDYLMWGNMCLLVGLFICFSFYVVSVELVVYLCLMVFFAALSSLEAIGTHGVRNFLLCKKPQSEIAKNAETEGTTIARRGHGRWKSWINKTLSLKIASH